MPARKHLNWTRIKEFGGLWTAGASTLMPANRAQVMSGCHPQVGGGLRSFYKVTDTRPNTGLTALGSDEFATGFGVILRGPFSDDIPADVVLMLVTVGTAAEPLYDDWKVWRWESDKGATSWAGSTPLGVTTGILTSPARQAQFSFLRVGGEVTGVRQVYVGLLVQDAALTATGLYLFDPDDGTLTKIDATYYGGDGTVQHQARLLTGHGDSVQFTAPGTATFTSTGGLDLEVDPPADPAAGFIRPNPSGAFLGTGDVSEEPYVAWMLSVPPGDFLVATRDGRLYNVQGDIADPSIQELAFLGASIPHEPVSAPAGVFIIVPNVGVVRVGLDGSTASVSHGLLPSVWGLRTPKTGLGQLASAGAFIFAPNQHVTAAHRNGALVYDTDLKAWFTSTHEDDAEIVNPRFMVTSPDYRRSGVWLLSGAAPGALADGADYAFNIQTGSSLDEDGSDPEQRNSTWEWQSAPLRDPDGHYIDIREVEVPVYAWNASSTLDVTVGTVTHTRTLPAGRSVQSFLYRQRGEDLAITVKAASNDAAVEAPMVEEVAFGAKSGPLL